LFLAVKYASAATVAGTLSNSRANDRKAARRRSADRSLPATWRPARAIPAIVRRQQQCSCAGLGRSTLGDYLLTIRPNLPHR
jgi:hypothetical protein